MKYIKNFNIFEARRPVDKEFNKLKKDTAELDDILDAEDADELEDEYNTELFNELDPDLDIDHNFDDEGGIANPDTNPGWRPNKNVDSVIGKDIESGEFFEPDGTEEEVYPDGAPSYDAHRKYVLNPDTNLFDQTSDDKSKDDNVIKKFQQEFDETDRESFSRKPRTNTEKAQIKANRLKQQSIERQKDKEREDREYQMYLRLKKKYG